MMRIKSRSTMRILLVTKQKAMAIEAVGDGRHGRDGHHGVD
jgi:hypothetical protein